MSTKFNLSALATTALELGLTQEKYADHLLDHLGQIPDFARLEDTLDHAIEILSAIPYRKRPLDEESTS